jgi:hypothetical protein
MGKQPELYAGGKCKGRQQQPTAVEKRDFSRFPRNPD